MKYGVQRRPEFFIALSKLLKFDFGDAWIKNKNECKVIKFRSPIENIADYTFDISNEDKELYDSKQIELKKRKWVIYQSLAKLVDHVFYSNARTCFCYLKQDISVPYSDIIKIYTPDEYIKEYRIEE
ncbi:MAG: hypothetical protein E6778_06660 [Niallia nealsonii]|nr:hypothetical protein [Niallia nealsonii]